MARRSMLVAHVLTPLVCGIVAGCVGPAAPTRLPDLSVSNVIEALFLGGGPLADTRSFAAGGCLPPGVFNAFARGTTIALVVATSIDDTGFAALQQAAWEAESVNNGRFHVTIERGIVADPTPGRFQITSADVPVAEVESTCRVGAGGCTRIVARDGPVFLSVRTIQTIGSGPKLKAHEFGHAIGLCHVSVDRMPEAAMAEQLGLPTGPHFSDLELRAMRAVYESALEPGALRADFVRTGLITP